jgi:hypothetical protein
VNTLLSRSYFIYDLFKHLKTDEEKQSEEIKWGSGSMSTLYLRREAATIYGFQGSQAMPATPSDRGTFEQE